MADIEHKNITDPELHEPKGVSAAGAGTQYIADGAGAGSWSVPEPKGASTAGADEAYLADGAGSGAWTKVNKPDYACVRVTSGLTTGVTTSFQAINDANLGGTVVWATNTSSTGITVNETDGYLQATEAGIYNININLSFLAEVNLSTFTVTIGVDSGTGIVEKSANVKAIITAAKSAETSLLTLLCLPSLLAGDKVYAMIKEEVGNELTIQFGNFIIHRVD